ncbi:hypothetical protein [Salicibibacter halophilus]|uniref:hypothetical protein n=1 Tax=Salicibibacter halophilus TaxID=2502791 RepID=UPI00135CBD78|nr:hypothetical protein [Salicibibacter halophilus]
MISAGLQAFPMHKDAPEVFSTSMQGVGETLDPTFAQLFAHSQRKDEAFVQHPELKNNLATHEKRINKGFLNEEALEALRGWAQSLSEFESFFQDFDWETAVIITEKALSENEGGILSSGDLASYMDGADLSIEEMVEMAITEGLNAEKPFGFTKETKKVIVPFLMALIDAPVEKEGMQKVTPQQLARYIQQWYLGGRRLNRKTIESFPAARKKPEKVQCPISTVIISNPCRRQQRWKWALRI